MEKTLECEPLPDGLGLLLKVEGTRPLAELTAAVNAVCDQVADRHETTVVVLELSSTPVEFREWPGDVDIQAVNRWERAVRRLEKQAAVTIAVARGTCGGPVLDLLLAADFRIGAPGLQLLLPVNDGHFWPGMLMYRLVQHLGMARARQIVMWGVDLPLAKASELGLIDQVSEDLSDALHTAAVLTGRISDRETAVRRQLLLEAVSTEYEEALGVHLAACDRELRRLRHTRDAESQDLARQAAS
ncbi:enoyl-CoA-hydratase DpgB [Streptomyces sviceus]|uniref:enoyl-CoA-hydratase DpgB n=1 Tax=Streptomyces sviceus TaxID=285530 RepID=UPI00367D4921